MTEKHFNIKDGDIIMEIKKNSAAYKVPFIKPNVKVMYQIDFKRTDSKPKDPETNIHKFGCNFMCCLAAPQFVKGKKLRPSQIIDIYLYAVKSGWLDYDCTVISPNEIMNYAAQILNDKKHKYANVFVKAVASGSDWNVSNYQHTSDLPGNGNVYFFIVDFLTGSTGNYGGHHFELYNSIGTLMYDPAKGTVHKYKDVNKISCYKVFLKK